MARRYIVWLADSVLIMAFFALLWTPLLLSWRGWGKAEDLHENRLLADLPDLATTRLADLPKKIDAFVRDRLPYRTGMIRLYSLWKYKYLKVRSAQVVPGKDNWLFYDFDHCESYDYMGLDPLLPEHLALWKQFLQRRAAYLAVRGIRYLFVVVPNKTTIYPEMLPDHIRRNKGRTRLEQLTEYLAHQPAVDILNLTGPIREAKKLGQVYFCTDTHWNGLGCYAGIGGICQRLKQWFGEIDWKPLGIDWEVQKTLAPAQAWGTPGADLWAILGIDPGLRSADDFLVRRKPSTSCVKKTALPSNWPPVQEGIWYVPKTISNEGRTRRLVVLGDSFFNSGVLGPTDKPLADCFGHSLFITKTNVMISHAQLRSLVEQEHPDVVVEEMVERFIKAAVPDQLDMAPAVEPGNVALLGRRAEAIGPAVQGGSIVTRQDKDR